ncbi:hypothetical protein RJT34_02133 [Clitoria ternatea]|uniref:Legume lectin domain-containing protein n=1 Tax=Clitoria ternatea TaxID=43366 RepID=A0AAN9KKZ7_CLITE
MGLAKTKPVLLILIPFLMMHRNSETSFNFPNFSGPYINTIINFQGDAFASNGVINPTMVLNGDVLSFSAGRATYALPVRLWDSKTGKMASFTTSFSFVIQNSPKSYVVGDGVSFFIAPFQSKIPEGSEGGNLGLFSHETASRNPIVAVEFDTHPNEWDPPFVHVGIDVNSIASVVAVEWKNHKTGLTTVSATVKYVGRNLSVVVSNNGLTTTLSRVIDLRTVLPEWVSVGFSGSTGSLVEVHKFQSWTFSSSFD